jgi:hypothetical protein
VVRQERPPAANVDGLGFLIYISGMFVHDIQYTQVTSVFQRGNEILAGRLDGHLPADSSVSFICECDSSDCYASVPLPLAAYRQLRELDLPLRATGH